MSFYGERYRRKGEEDIWEELKYWLQNPVTEEEQALRNQQKQMYIDKVLNRAFPAKQQTTKSEPYLNYEDLLNKSIEPLKNKINEIIPLNNYLNSTLPEEAVFPKERFTQVIDGVKETATNVFSKDKLKDIAGIGLQVASLHPGIKGPKLATQGVGMVAKGVGAMQKNLAPKIGKKLSQEISENLVQGGYDGVLRGAIEGFGRGLVMDENPFKTAAQDSVAATILGAAGGTVAPNVEKVIRGKNLKKIEDLKLLRKKETDFYKDYIQGTKSRHQEIGNIEYTQSGLETVSKQPNAGRDFDSLKKELNNAEYVKYELPHHKKHGTKDNIRGFHKLKNNSKEFLIADTPDGAKYYMSKQIGDVSNRPSRVEPTSPNSIIPPPQNNLNPSQQSIQKPLSQKDWLEELKRRRKKLGWW